MVSWKFSFFSKLNTYYNLIKKVKKWAAAIAQLAKHMPGMREALSPIPGTEKWKFSLRNLESKVLNHGNSPKGLEGAVSKHRNQGQKHGSAGKFTCYQACSWDPKGGRKEQTCQKSNRPMNGR